MVLRVLVVTDITGLQGEDGVVAAHACVFARVPDCSTLAIYDHSSAYLLACIRVSGGIVSRGLQLKARTGCLFGTQSLPRTILGSVGSFRGFMGGITDVRERGL